MNVFRWSILLVSILNTSTVYAQRNATIERVLDKFAIQEAEHPSSTLFLHCDKTLYTNNETIWFAAYLQANRGTPIQKHHTLSVALLNDESRKINLSELYVMEAGVASGSILLPDTIAPGNYHLVAYTNIVDKMGMPFDVFSMPLTIKSTLEKKFNASIRLLDTAQNFIGNRRISIRASGIPIRKNGQYPPATISYYTNGKEPKSVQTDGNGEAIVAIEGNSLNQANNYIYASVSYNDETHFIFLSLPVADPKKISIKFYPEGGTLVQGLTSNIGFEALSANGRPLSLRAVICKDNKPIDTVETSISGMGSFKITPIQGSIYTLKVFKSNLSTKDTVYNLPVPVKDMPVISMAKAVTTDTLSFTLKSKLPQNFQIIVHNTHELLASFQVIANTTGRSVKIALKNVPKGIAAVTILDSLGNPLAERLFFAHYTAEDQLMASTDKSVYKPREKVSLKLRLKEDVLGNEEKALVSVSAVQGSRVEAAKSVDMESYTYLEHELSKLPRNPTGAPYRNKKYVEDLLLIRGWRRFVWNDKTWSEKIDTTGIYSSLALSGTITKNKKQIADTIHLNLLRDTIFNVVTTNGIGKFELNADISTVFAGKKLLFIFNKADENKYKIKFESPFDQSNALINHQIHFVQSIIGETESNSLKRMYKGTDKQIQIKAVEIKSNNYSEVYGTGNSCGDYVCKYNYLNCPYHPPGPESRIPIKGRTYSLIKKIHGGGVAEGTTIYKGCGIEDDQSIFFALKGRQISKEFYVNDYKNDILSGSDFQSTLYWAPFLQISSSKDTEITFYTSDLTGSYKLSVQGISEKQVVTGTTTFKVE